MTGNDQREDSRPTLNSGVSRCVKTAAWLMASAAAVILVGPSSPAAAPERSAPGGAALALIADEEPLEDSSTDDDATNDDATMTVEGTRVPDPLVLDNGDTVDSVQTWERQRRPELLDAFQAHVYGQSLPEPTDITFDDQQLSSEGGKKVTIEVTGPEGSASFTLRLFVPTDTTPKGTLLLIDHRGSVGDEPSSSGYAPTTSILEDGYAFAALDAGEVAPDDAGSYRSGVIDAFSPSERELPDDAGRAISAWAWGTGRAMDYLETDPDIDPDKVAVIGHSRGGKAALWAGAQDTRFPVVSNNSGSTGAKLARRDDSGESIAAVNDQFPHWFPPTYQAYADDADSLPVDQHQLLALIAPGRVVVASATDDANADPQGEFLSYLGAAPVYELYGLGDTGLSSQNWPPTTDKGFRGPAMSYHLRTGDHGLDDADWDTYLSGNLFKR